MDVATLGAVGTIVVGIAAAAAALIGQRGQSRAAHTGVVMTGYGGLVDNLQEERDRLTAKVTENERLLAEAYAALAGAAADKAQLQTQITELTLENARLREQITQLGGTPP
ncbi:hypothetical protein [Streptomyces wuyuanensis]|uniref:hypothetical protein n=1 Tax=Streptomyces wuyuanensis TaxID=1196353 RepID=UPI0037BB04AD